MVFAAVELDAALESTVKKREIELREMEAPIDEVSTFKIIKTIKELVASALFLLGSMREEWLAAVPGTLDRRCFLVWHQRRRSSIHSAWGQSEDIVDISYQIIDNVQELLGIGEEVRYIDQHSVTFVVVRQKTQYDSA